MHVFLIEPMKILGGRKLIIERCLFYTNGGWLRSWLMPHNGADSTPTASVSTLVGN